jgi:phosphoribosylanthranilate isomerase
MEAKICGVKDINTLKYIINHKYPPKFIGFIINYKKSKRYVKIEKLKKLISIKKNKVFFVAVMVNPEKKFLEKIKNINFDFYQLYNTSPTLTKTIKKKYKKKIITALTIENKNDVKKYKKFKTISDIILFDSKGYEKSLGFDHKLLKGIPKSITKMLAGNIQYDDILDKYSKIADIIDISGSLETLGKKDKKKINFFLENINKIKNEN